MNLKGKAPGPESMVRRWRGVMMRARSLSPSASVMSDPKTQTACQSLAVVTIIADSGIMIERPIKRPATKLLACRNLVRGFFTIPL